MPLLQSDDSLNRSKHKAMTRIKSEDLANQLTSQDVTRSLSLILYLCSFWDSSEGEKAVFGLPQFTKSFERHIKLKFQN